MNFDYYNFVDEIMETLCLYDDYMTILNDDGTVDIDLEGEDYRISADYETLYDYFDNDDGFDVIDWSSPSSTDNDCYGWVAFLKIRKY